MIQEDKMCTERSTENKDKSACCNSGQFKSMFEMMSKCFTGKSGSSDCTEMMEQMKAAFCGPKKEESDPDCSG